MKRPRTRLLALAAAVVAAVVVPLTTAGAPAGAATRAPAAQRADAASAAGARQAEFAAAAKEFGVPEQVLLAVGYNESLWDFHGGQPSFSGGYGVMNLTDVTPAIVSGQGVPSGSRRATGELAAPALHTAQAAATLLGVDVSRVTGDEDTNIRGGAALLASYARRYDHGRLPRRIADWYAAVARYSQASEKPVAKVFADDVYQTIRSGASLTTKDGQQLTERPDRGAHPRPGAIDALHLTDDGTLPKSDPSFTPECPASLHCTYIPAPLEQTGSSKAAYGDHDPANRPEDLPIRYITLHDTEETYDGTVWLFQDPTYEASIHYVVSTAGSVTQMIPDKDIAWDSANQSVYQHSVGIEQEGYAVKGATWYSEAMYHSTAALVRYLAAKYDIPLDRNHILGHDTVPGASERGIATQHWDPGPYWNWAHFMALVGAPIRADASRSSDVVTIDPSWSRNRLSFTGCLPIQTNTPYPGPYHVKEWANAADTDCPLSNYVTLPTQSSSMVRLHTAPSASAPLVADPYLHPDGSAGTDEANDWGDTASAGQQFVVADRKGDWTAIWFGGQEAWFHDPSGPGRTAVPTSAHDVVTPKAGRDSIPVYVTTYPEASAYPPAYVAWRGGVPHTQSPAQKYTIEAGQSYVAGGPAEASDWFNAYNIDGSAPFDQTDFVGTTKYYEITYNHRIAFVNAADVDVHASS